MADQNNNILEFNFKGELLQQTPAPDKKKFPFLSSPYYLNDSLYCYFCPNVWGMEKKRILLQDKNGKIRHIFPNYNLVPGYDEKSIGISWLNALFYRYRNKTYFREQYCDTIYEVTPEKLIPHFAINFGNQTKSYAYQFEYARHAQTLRNEGKMASPFPDIAIISQITENDSLIYFSLYYQKAKLNLFYRKSTGQVELLSDKTGFTDDIHQFLNIKIDRLLPGGQAIGWLKSHDIAVWFEAHSNEVLPAEVEKLRSVKMEDNPVLVLLES